MHLELKTERLTITPISDSDLDLVIDVFTDPEVMRFGGGPMSEEDIRSTMPDWTRRGGDGCVGIWCISIRTSGEKLGTLALLPMPVEEHKTDYSLVVNGQMPEGDIEIGYYLKRSAWGNGYASEAASRLVAEIFKGSQLAEIVATFDVGNAASRRVLEKVGFKNHGTARSYGTEGPNYRISKDDWSGQ